MCASTKHKIAAALRRLMMERPFQKITVQNLMDASGMKRQSFYYHFQDTRDVLSWICRQELILPLETSELEFEDWILKGLELLDRDRNFYRRAMTAGDCGSMWEQLEQLLIPRLSRLMYTDREPEELDVDRRFAVEFAARAVIAHAQQFVLNRRELDMSAARSRLRCLLDTFDLKRTAFAG